MFGNYPYSQPYAQPYNNYPQRYEILKVNGRNGAEALQMLPNSEALLLDSTAPLIWVAQTDGAGYKTLTPFTIAPYEPTPAPDNSQKLSDFETRLKRLEDLFNEKSNSTGTE